MFFFGFELIAFFSLFVLVKLVFFVSMLSSQFIETFSDFADVLRFNVDVIILVFIFLGAEIGSTFLLRRELIGMFGL